MRTFLSIHYLRGIAALGVLLFHAEGFLEGYGSQQLPHDLTTIGKAGVDIFFVISGFILTLVMGSSRGQTEFMLGRLARVGVPYWCVTLVLVAATLALPSAFRSFDWSGTDLLLSLSFIPSVARESSISPILEPGWTLCLEMLFYILLAASLSLAPSFRSAAVSAALCALVGIGLMLQLPQGGGVVWFFTQAVLVEFCFGIVIAQLFLKGWRTGKGPALALIGLALAGFAVAVMFPPGSYTAMRPVTYGIPAALLVAGTVLLEGAGGWFENRVLAFLGTISYSLYLTHVLALAVTAKILSGHVSGLGGDLVMLVAAIGAALAGGYIFYQLVERPALWLAAVVKKRMRDAGSSAPQSGDLIAQNRV
ncbi:acyltransferase [Methyloligella sp. 2.7D]|uniref:acyltransferase family protein n=1 Tax=unclassified Methyloligella TaxID=2625955 RepID=UPI00157BDA4A|nr:acyltransferase [Methyloligella sp. GL2]QKP76191.1 acyltransferase [Methyloligella sp. GL2]